VTLNSVDFLTFLYLLHLGPKWLRRSFSVSVPFWFMLWSEVDVVSVLTCTLFVEWQWDSTCCNQG